MAYSDDGIKWTPNLLPIGNGKWSCCAYGDGRWVAITGGWASAYSEDGGVTWKMGGGFPYRGNTLHMAFGNHRFIVVAFIARRTAPLEFRTVYSDDGDITWNVGGTTPQEYGRIIYANGRFISTRLVPDCNANIPHLVYSKDGLTWTNQDVGERTAANWHGIGYGNGRVVLVPDIRGV